MVYTTVFNPSEIKELQGIVYFSGENIYPDFNSKCTEKYFRICEQCAIKLFSNAIKVLGSIMVSSAIMPRFAAIAYIMDNDIQLPVPLLFPFTDLESSNGLVINLMHQGFLGFMVVGGNIGIELTSCIVKNTIGTTTAAISYSIDDLIEKFKNPKGNSITYIDGSFRNILIQAQDLDR